MVDEIAIQRRLPIWQALSEVFLDTELQPDDHARIAAILGSSTFSPAELQSIFEREVAPAFLPNLLSVAGEWTPWSRDEVRAIMLASLHPAGIAPVAWIKKALRRCIVTLHRRHLAAEWRKIAAGLTPSPASSPLVARPRSSAD